MCLLSLSFFYWIDDPRDLHSFPTRRSSDLERQSGSVRGALGNQRPSRDFNQPFGFHNPFPYTKPREAAQEDRKSTRLNSSHLGISYAVFCLKKKTSNSPRRLRR